MRHMLLAYNKLSFSQVYKLYKSLQQYYHSHYAKPTDGLVSLPALAADDSDMDLTSTEDTVGDRIEREEVDTQLHESELRFVNLEVFYNQRRALICLFKFAATALLCKFLNVCGRKSQNKLLQTWNLAK